MGHAEAEIIVRVPPQMSDSFYACFHLARDTEGNIRPGVLDTESLSIRDNGRDIVASAKIPEWLTRLFSEMYHMGVRDERTRIRKNIGI